MATLIPIFSSCSQRMTPGERRFAQRLQEKLEDEYLLWYNVPIGAKRLYPDFVILHPLRGIVVLEVKDWKLGTIQQVDRDAVTILTDAGMKRVDNPLEQARTYSLAIAQLLEHDPLLVQSNDRYRGKLAFPYSYGVVLSQITRKQFDSQPGLADVMQSNLVLCRDEFYERVDALALQEWLWHLCSYEFGEPLTAVQLDRVRWHLFPEIRIDQQLSLLPDEAETAEATEANETTEATEAAIAIPDLLRVMDIQQEQLARSMGDGHRVVHGVAGSGKTLVLVYRCVYLVEQTTKPILVLCFNVSLAAKLRQMLHEKGIGERVIVRNFHKWCHDLLWQYRIPKPSSNEFVGDAFWQEMVQRVIRGVDTGKIAAGQYGAVMIDEGHDFQPDWFKLVVQMIDPETNSLLVMYDDAQSIYEKQRKQTFSFASVGIQARGRTTILKINYRNTQEVLNLAYEFAEELMTPTGNGEDDEPVLVKPESAGRHGPKPKLIKLSSFKQEVDYLVDQVQQVHEQGMPWNEIAVIYRAKWMGEKIYQRFQQSSIPVGWLGNPAEKQSFNLTDPSLKLVTMHSSKGLEFRCVFIPGVGYLPNSHNTPDDEAKLLYVAMTRAIERLVLTCDRLSPFVERLKAALTKPG